MQPCRLAWITHDDLQSETITNANARLVEAHAALPLTAALCSTELASADGLRFVVPVRSVHAAANLQCFGPGKGVTHINYTSASCIGIVGYGGAPVRVLRCRRWKSSIVARTTSLPSSPSRLPSASATVVFAAADGPSMPTLTGCSRCPAATIPASTSTSKRIRQVTGAGYWDPAGQIPDAPQHDHCSRRADVEAGSTAAR
ncbi:MAG: Tn3 family transposase [Chloroflexi bacterium]|nr:Tn3 family transposase [Chloroflexota bacterium]